MTIGADDSVEEALRTMKEHKVRRPPVIDGTTWSESRVRAAWRPASTKSVSATSSRSSPPPRRKFSSRRHGYRGR